MPDALVTIQLEGIEADGGDVRLGEFIEELSAIKNALRNTQRLVLRSDSQAIEYKISDLSHTSPATVTVLITSSDPVFKDAPRRISKRFTSSLRLVQSSHRYAARLDTKTLELFRNIAAPTKKHVRRLVVTGEKNQAINIDREFERKVHRLLQGDKSERDEIVGKLERLDIHNKNQFDIYPVIGPVKVRCSAPARLQEKLIKAIGKTVAVDGWAHYHVDSPFPHEMKVEDIREMQDDGALPRLSDIHGMAPRATDGLSGEDFVRKLRDAYW